MPNRRLWASNLLSRRANLNRRNNVVAKNTAAKYRRLRLFESLEQRALLAALAWYPLDEVSGSVATDTTGNGYNGTLTGGAWADGQTGGAIDFNVDGNVSVPAAAFATIDQEASFAFWAYGGDTQPINNSVLYGVNATGDRVVNVHLPFSNGKVYWDAGEDAGYDRILKTADPLLHRDSWHHWAFTKNASTGNMNIYLDGAPWASGTGKTRSMAGITSFSIGANTNGSDGYDGLLDDVRIYDHELTSAEVLTLFTSTSSPNTEEVLATNRTYAATQNATTVITSASLETTDVEQSAAELTYTVTGLPGGGTVDRAGAALALYDVFTQDDIDNGLVTYSQGGGSNADSFTFAVNDGFGSSTSGTFNIVVSQNTANSLAELRAFGTTVNNTLVTLSATGGDPHPVTGIVTPGEYWINGDHIANPTGSEPIFLELGGNGNTYDLTGTSINLDTRKFDGFGRALGHGSGVRVVKVSGDGNTLNNLTLSGFDLATDTDPDAQRHADWAAVYFQVVGTNNTIDGADILTRGSSPYGLSDVFGKGARKDPQGWPPGPAVDENGDPVGNGFGLPWYAHRKTSAFNVIDTVNAVINDMHLDVNTYGHGFFVQGTAENTTLTNSTVTGELFSSNDAIATDLYQDYGFTSHGNELPPNMMISGNEDGVRMYTGASGLTVQNVVVTNMRTGFSVALGRGTMTLDNVEAYGTENAFNFKSNTTITNAKGDIKHGPLLHTPYDSSSNTSVEVELVGGVPEGVDWSVAYLAGNNLDVTIDSSVAAGDLPEESFVRFGHVFYDNWRDANNPTGPEDHGDRNYDYINSTFHNNTNQMLVLGNEVTGNNGSSQAGVISNGKDNSYDGVTLIINNSRLVLEHVNGLGNGGTAADGSLETNASIVTDGSTLELEAGIRIVDEKLTITGDGIDGKGALFTDGDDARFGSSSGSDESIVSLDGDASIGVGSAGDELLVGRLEGTGNLTKLGAGNLGVEKSSDLVGDLIVAEGHVTGRSNVVRHGLTVAAGASISGISNNTINTFGDVDLDGTLDLNARSGNFISVLSHTIGRLNGSGQVTSTNTENASSGGKLTLNGDGGDGLFSGSIDGVVELIKSGTNTQVLAGNLTHTGTTTINEGMLSIDGTHIGGEDYSVNSGGTLGGNGAIGSAVIVNPAGRLSPGASAGTLSVNDVTFLPGALFDVEVGGASVGTEYDRLIADSVALDGVLSVSLLDLGAGAYQPLHTETFTVLVSNSSLTGAFDNVASGQRIATLGGEGTFLVTYDTPGNAVVLSNFESSQLDFGDAPASYGTLLANDGARHAGEGPRLGALRDLETDGQASVVAAADGSDEDGVMFGSIEIGNPMAGVNIDLQNAAGAKVDAWIDFDGDGIWQSNEKILDDVAVIAGLQTLNYSLPSNAPTGQTIARVRLSSVGGLQATGFASDGEVEDYVVTIADAAEPMVESIVVNQGEVQRSRVREVTITFNTEVTAPLAAFSIHDRATLDHVNVALASEVLNGKTIATLTFAPGPGVINSSTGLHSLADGNYELVITGSLVTAGSQVMAADHQFGTQASDLFFRYFGDRDGDRDVDGQDYGRFGLTFLRSSTDPAYDVAFDFTGDDDVDGQDYGQFGLRFLSQLGF